MKTHEKSIQMFENIVEKVLIDNVYCIDHDTVTDLFNELNLQ